MDQSNLFISLAIIVFLMVFLIMLFTKPKRTVKPGIRASGKSRLGKIVMALGMAIGLGIGAAAGIVLNNILIGGAIGVTLGASLGVSFDAVANKKAEQSNYNSTSGFQRYENSRATVMMGLMAILFGVIALGLILFFKLK